MISLSVGETTLQLPPDLVWSDEFAWAATAQSVTRSLTGALIVQSAPRLQGRPITLQAPEYGGWMQRSAWAQIQTWLDEPGQRMTLALRGVDWLVEWRHVDGGAEAADVLHYEDPDSDAFIQPTFRFMTVSA